VNVIAKEGKKQSNIAKIQGKKSAGTKRVSETPTNLVKFAKLKRRKRCPPLLERK